MNETTRTEADAVAEIAYKAAQPDTIPLPSPTDGREIIALPKGVELKSIKPFLDEYLTAPERKKGSAKFEDLASFIEHTNRFKDVDSAIFADPDPTDPKLTSVLDYHRQGDGPARFGTHRGVYEFPLSEEWTAWAKANREMFAQQAFAEFVENRLLDIVDPTTAGEAARAFAVNLGSGFAAPSKILELSRGISINANSRLQKATNLSSGETQLQYATQHVDDTNAPIKVPNAFLIQIPVFRNGPLYQLPVRLRYRLRESAVTWFYELYRPERAFEDAFKEAAAAAKEATSLPLFVGAPES